MGEMPAQAPAGKAAMRRLTRAEMEAAALEGRQIGADLPVEVALSLLRDGELEIVGRLLEASNATFFGVVSGGTASPDLAASCVYKPIRGERPLRDFPNGTLACREVAAFAVSEASGWHIVPPTVMRDGAFGRGMVQLWMETDRSVDLAELVAGDAPALRRIALFDAVLNNADRKGGHLLPLPDGRVLAIDNGLSFAVEPKLRTVLWRWRGQPFEAEERAFLDRLGKAIRGSLGDELRELLSPLEVAATARRIDRLIARGRFPMPARDRPVVPWPPF
jgi:uncharacterized repeat protein (TIGR03843 family)